jgi:glutamate--cysteine ligase
MTLADRGTLTCPKLVDYFLRASRPREQWLVGMEHESLGQDVATGRPLAYDAPGASVRKVLEHLLGRRGGAPIYEGEHLIGIDGPWGTVSLEPGGQLEWSSRPRPSLGELARDLEAHVLAMHEAAGAVGVRWLDVALDPDHPVDAMAWMPRARYKIMSRFLGARGRLAHRMMTQTTSIQCAFDYESPEDWTRKFRAAALLSPVATALFANSARAEGRDTGWKSFRQAIWRDTDPARCGLPSVVFDPGFDLEAWAEWVLDVPTIFVHRARGLLPTGGVPFRGLLDRIGCEAASLEDWELHLSAIFTDVRSYTYIEVRSADLQPDDRILAVPAFWTGILYHPDGLDAALELGRGHDSYGRWLEAMEQAARHGLDGRAGGAPLREMAVRALAVSARNLRSGAACAGGLSDPAEPVLALADSLGLELPAEAV